MLGTCVYMYVCSVGNSFPKVFCAKFSVKSDISQAGRCVELTCTESQHYVLCFVTAGTLSCCPLSLTPYPPTLHHLYAQLQRERIAALVIP